MHNLKQYSNDQNVRPTWNPNPLRKKTFSFSKKLYNVVNNIHYPIYIAENVLSEETCNALIEEFEKQEKYPVGVDGYSVASDNVGSYRAMAWAEEFSDFMTNKIQQIVDERYIDQHNGVLYSSNGAFMTSLEREFPDYKLLGSTPWMRFMRYSNGGKHVPHYDAPFINPVQKYATLFSWVLYLNTPDGNGGEFQFVDDKRNAHIINPYFWNRSDWTNMSNDVIISVKPERGKLLIFPHWLCHQVNEYIGTGYRYIIRGDVAYGY